MSERVSAVAPANIAFIKYWGARDLARLRPCNPSVSMTLSDCVSHCTVSREDGPADRVYWDRGDGRCAAAPAAFAGRVVRQLDALRARCSASGALRVVTRNSFPAAAGIASSASGGTALALAAATLLAGRPATPELSVLAQLGGSGSAARSATGGYMRWPAEGAGDGPAVQLHGPEHWALCDVVAVVEEGAKAVSSREGHRRAAASRYFGERQRALPSRTARVLDALAGRDLEQLGEAIEQEALDLHLVAMSSEPPIFYWKPATLAVWECVRELRAEGTSAWVTMDAGPNVHVVGPGEAETAIAERLAGVPGVARVLRDRVGDGPRLSDDHLEAVE